MTPVAKRAVRKRLLELRAELESLADTGDEAARIVELDQSRVGRLSRMDALQAQAMAKASSERRDAMLGRINAALGRVARGEYGLCQLCEEPIHPKRLDVDPTALLCIECAERTER